MIRFFRRAWLDIRMGKCSGFPDCCVAWYVTGWRLIFGSMDVSLYKKSTWRARLILWYHEKGGLSGYVPCPLCLISGARVKVRKCTPECGHHEECRQINSCRPYVRDR